MGKALSEEDKSHGRTYVQHSESRGGVVDNVNLAKLGSIGTATTTMLGGKKAHLAGKEKQNAVELREYQGKTGSS